METKNIYAALAAINKGIKAIGKSNFNESQRFYFRGVDDIMNELHGLFAENGVVIIPEIEEQSQQTIQTRNGGVAYRTLLRVKYTFVAEDSSNVTCTAMGESHDSADKGVNKALSAALKYALLQMFLIPTAEKKDPDHDDIQRSDSNAQAKKVQAQVSQDAPLNAELSALIWGALTKEELLKVYNENPGWQGNKAFMAALSTKRQTIDGTARKTA